MWILWMALFGLQQSGENLDVYPFFSEEKNKRFTMVIMENLEDRRFKTIAEVLRKNFALNLVVDESANVQIKGNFTDISVNELLTYLVKTYDLEWYRVGDIFHFKKVAPPNFEIDMVLDETSGLMTIETRNADLTSITRRWTDLTGKNMLAMPDANLKVSGYIRDLEPGKALSALLLPYKLNVADYEDFFRVEAMEGESGALSSALTKPADKPPALTFTEEGFQGQLDAGSLARAVDALAEPARRSIKLLDPLEGGRVSIFFRGQDFDSALNKLFLATPYSYKVLDGIYLVGAKNRPELTTSEMIVVKHMNAQNVLAYLSGENALFQTYALPSLPDYLGDRNNRGNRDNRFRGNRSSGIQGRRTQPIQNTVQQQANRENLKTSVQLSEAVSADIVLVREHNALMVTATRDVIEEIRERLVLIDRPVPQVLIQALVVDFRTDDEDSYGLSITNGDFSYFPEVDVTLEGNRAADGSFQITRLPSNFQVRIQALASQGKARIISKPHIATLSGHEAYIEVGLTQSLLLTSETLVGDETPRTQTSERIETVEANISLRVIPWVTASGEITTYIEPIFNSFLGAVEDNVPPPISTRRLQSTIRLKNGETIILGGLIEETLRRNTRGVPGLSRIPILGYLFKNQNRNFEQSELVIYLTPYVYYGDEGSVTIIEEREGLDYPLDVREQKKLLRENKPKRRWRNKKGSGKKL